MKKLFSLIIISVFILSGCKNAPVNGSDQDTTVIESDPMQAVPEEAEKDKTEVVSPNDSITVIKE